jgi:flagellar protein FlaG
MTDAIQRTQALPPQAMLPGEAKQVIAREGSKEVPARPELPAFEPVLRQELAQAIDKVQDFVAPITAELRFTIDEESGMRIVKVVDQATSEVIRQIPSEELVEIAKTLERLQGLLIRQKA